MHKFTTGGIRGRHGVPFLLWLTGLFFWLSPCQANIYTVTTIADSGVGSLRQAVLNANTNALLPSPGVQTIKFQLPTRPYTITLATNLPVITVPVIIDATTQTGYTNKPIVEIIGTTTTTNSAGFELAGGQSVVRGLVMNRFAGNAIQLDADSNTIAGNWIGTDTNGVLIRSNRLYGIFAYGSRNLIGSTNPADRNVISGNDTGIYLMGPGSNNVVLGNWIGVNASNSLTLGNVNNGILIFNSPGNVIGGTNAGAANVLSGNLNSGLYLYQPGSTGNVIQGNLIGTDASGSIMVSNNYDGITLNAASGNLIGPGNVISGNGLTGINFANAAAGSNTVIGNFIGTDKTGSLAVRNVVAGISINGGSANQIGGTNAGAGNVISGNWLSGIQMAGGAQGNWVQGNLIGVNASGTSALANGVNGIAVSSSTSNFIGGTLSSARNIISGNTSNGVYLQLGSGNQLQGNYIGTDITGLKALANGLAGVLIQANSNLVGGSVAGSGNVISGNKQQGIFLAGTSGNVVGNVIQGNIIGLDANGVNSLGNANAGIGISSAVRNQIGGAVASAGNLISGNGDAGIFVFGSLTTGNVIQGNYIGTDITGRLARGNAFEGIYSQDAVTNQIGGSLPGQGNLISANGTRGIWFTNSSWNTIQGNNIGTDVTGTNNLGNNVHSVEFEVSASHNTLGGTNAGAGNRIAFAKNGYAGVRIRDGAQNNLISGNAIFGNTGLGIDLGNYWVNGNVDCESGVAANAANAWQNFPVITNAVCGPNSTLIRGFLGSATGKTYQLQFFANPFNDPSGCGQGRIFLGTKTLTLGNSCSSNFMVLLPITVPTGWVLAATASDAANNTSEFSADFQAVNPPTVQIALAGASQQSITIRGVLKTFTVFTNTMIYYTNLSGPFTVQQTFSLAPPQNWVAVTNSLIQSNGNYSMLVTGQTNAFFRLIAP